MTFVNFCNSFSPHSFFQFLCLYATPPPLSCLFFIFVFVLFFFLLLNILHFHTVRTGLSEHEVSDVAELLSMMGKAHGLRSTGSTGANLESSRSHQVLYFALLYCPVFHCTALHFTVWQRTVVNCSTILYTENCKL